MNMALTTETLEQIQPSLMF